MSHKPRARAEIVRAEPPGQAATAQDPSAAPRIGVDALYRAHGRFVATFLQRLGTPPHEIDDLVQEVFVIAHRKGGYVQGPAQPRSWLGAIATHVARAGRKSRRRHEAPDTPAAEELRVGADVPALIDQRRSLERIQRALEQLPLEQRAAFVLFEIDGESCESIAAVWEVPVGTVYSRLHHARRKFMQTYAELTAAASRPLTAAKGGR